MAVSSDGEGKKANEVADGPLLRNCESKGEEERVLRYGV